MNDQPGFVPAPPPVPSIAQVPSRSSWKKKLLVTTGIVLGTAGIAAASTAWWVKHNIYASQFQPVALNQAEQEGLDNKLKVLGQNSTALPVDPEVAKRTMTISEKEINAFFAQQGLGEQVKVELTEGAAAAVIVMPVDRDAPLIGGTTLRIRVAFGAKMDKDKHLALSLSDVHVGGVPLPNAWLGNLKGLNLLSDSPMQSDPAVKGFLEGIRDFKIQRGSMQIVLNE
ncbi:MAG: hypothetical protein JWO89_1960 [Verrucomicrobiaceae bacterium]|nr:hypothetical protein [Verrucomicrobiaceae bacterium]MDB6116501.1 hypothetical protein [Verrucomicrobiaceae bacterium]